MIDNSGCLNRLNNNNVVSSDSSGVDHNLQHQPTVKLLLWPGFAVRGG